MRSHTVYLAHEHIKVETRGRSRHKNNSLRLVWNMEGKNVGSIRGEMSQTRPNNSAEDLIIYRASRWTQVPLPYIRLTDQPNLT